MEFDRWKEPGQNYQQSLTYIKGALVLHMLRRFVGDEAFDRALAWYLKKHEYSSVELGRPAGGDRAGRRPERLLVLPGLGRGAAGTRASMSRTGGCRSANVST